MKKIFNIVFGAIFLISSVISVIVFAQNYINFSLPFSSNINDFESAYLTVCILMAICLASSFIYMIINFFSIRWITLINSIIGFVIALTLTIMCGLYYGVLKANIDITDKNMIKALEFLPLILIGIVFVPATVSFCSILKIKH